MAAVTPLHGGQLALTALQGLLGMFPKIVESLTNLGISLWNPGAVVYNLLMIFALSENSATQELLHRRHPELRVLWHAGLVEIVAHVIVADVDEYWLHDHTRYLQSLRTEAVKWFFCRPE